MGTIKTRLLTGTLALSVLMPALLGCSRRYHDLPAYLPFANKEYPNESVGRFKSSYIIDQIDEFYRGTDPGPIGVTTLVNIDDLYSTSTFGRIYSEQIISELAMRGYDVIELRHADAIQFLGGAGEFALSRDMGSVRRERKLGGVVVGTYAVSTDRVYVNIRLLDPSTSAVVSAGSVEMSKTKELAKLLKKGGAPTTLERIPVRHVALSAVPLSAVQGMPEQVYPLESDPSPSRGITPRLPGKKR